MGGPPLPSCICQSFRVSRKTRSLQIQGSDYPVERCRVLLLKQKIQNFGTSDSLRENHAVENQAKGFETHGLNFTPNKQAVQNGKQEKILSAKKKCFVFCQAPNISRAAGEFQQSSLELMTTQRNSRSFQGTGGLWRIAVALVTPLVTPHLTCSTQGSVPVPRNRRLGILSRLYSVIMDRCQRIHQDWLGYSAEVFKTHSTETIYPFS